MHRQNFNAIGFFRRARRLPKHAYCRFLEIKLLKNDCRWFFSTFANFEQNKNCKTFWTCISKTTHPKVSFGKIKWNFFFRFCLAILDPYWHALSRLYKAFAMLHFSYCLSLWHFCGARNTEKINTLYKILFLTCYPGYVRNMLSLWPVSYCLC